VPIVTALDSALTAANRLYETLQQTGQQASAERKHLRPTHI
jgi:hypothetical protein